MTPFTEDELAFLRRHHFSEDDVHDGRSQGKRGRESSAKTAGKILVLTNTRCRAMGHRIRTRAGHCAQCNTANIAFTARETSPGNVYIAGSLSGRLIKIGTTGDITRRIRQQRTEQYGGFGDWSVLTSIYVNDAGKMEREVSSRIRGGRVFNGYIKDGHEQVAIEIIRCSFSAAFKALSDAVGGILESQYWLDQNREYEFD
jgi:T5orf172 domain